MISEKYRNQRMFISLVILFVFLVVSHFFGASFLMGLLISSIALVVYFMTIFIRSTEIMQNMEPKFEESIMYLTLKKGEDVIHVYLPVIELKNGTEFYQKQLDEGYEVIAFDMLNFMYKVDAETDKRGALKELNK